MRRPETITPRQAANRIAKGLGSYAYSPRHPELCRELFFDAIEGAEKKLATFNATHGLAGGEIVSFLRVVSDVREFVPDRSGHCRMTTAMAQRPSFIRIQEAR